MTLIILEQAEREFINSISYYESKETGLGIRFRDEVVAAMNWILARPDIPRIRSRGYRRVNLRVFSHYIAHVIRGEKLWVVAIAHGHQRPEFWLKRTAEL